MKPLPPVVSVLGALLWTPTLVADTWPVYADETATRLIADPSVGVSDVEEKDYAWGDVDQDGDVDLVVVRKQAFNTPGRFRNVLFMNEGIAEGHGINGVLVDRTSQYATDATDGGQGFLDLTADRDVALVDVNDDGAVNVLDLIEVLLAFGTMAGGPADVNGDGAVNVLDLIEVLLHFGQACP